MNWVNKLDKERPYNRIYNKEDWNKVNQQNKNILVDFIEEYKQQKKKKSTNNQYHNDLRIILIYILKFLDNRCIFELTKKDFRRLSLWFSEDLHLSNARSNRLMCACRSMLTFCENDDDYEYDMNVAKKVKGLPKEPVRTDEDSIFLTHKQIMKLREELIRRNELQLAVLLMISYDSCGRRGEVSQVKKQGLINGNKTNQVIGKRGKIFPLTYLNDTKELIRLYLEQRGEDLIESLWVLGDGDKKREASYDNLYEWTMKLRKIISEIEGKELNIFHHTFRHSRIEALLQGEDDRLIDSQTGLPKKFTLEQVQRLAHHESPQTTQGYSRDHSEDIINEMFNLN